MAEEMITNTEAIGQPQERLLDAIILAIYPLKVFIRSLGRDEEHNEELVKPLEILMEDAYQRLLGIGEAIENRSSVQIHYQDSSVTLIHSHAVGATIQLKQPVTFKEMPA